MTYTINPNAKNVWIRDNEDTMDLSPITDASSVYLENGRTIEQELGEGSMVSNVATVDTSMTKVIDGTLDGAYESGVMYGRSLVNLVSGGNEQRQVGKSSDTLAKYNYVYQLDHTKTYTIFFEVSGFVGTNPFAVSMSTGDDGCGSITQDGIYKIKFTPRSYHEGRLIGVWFFWEVGKWSDENQAFVKNVVVLEGDYTNQDLPFINHFDGICDVKMPILRNIGKNLLELNDTTLVKTVGTNNLLLTKKNGGLLAKKDSCVKGSAVIYIEIPNAIKGRKYQFSATITSTNMNRALSFYGGNTAYSFLVNNNGRGDGSRVVSDICTFNPSWDKFCIVIGDHGTLIEGANISIEISDLCVWEVDTKQTSMPYEPYKSNILHTPETVTLRSLPNGVRDELNLKTGEYIKRIGEVVLDGSENNWITIFNYNETDDYSTFKLDTALPNGKTVTYPLDAYIVDKMQNKLLLSEPMEFVHINNQPRVCIKLLQTRLSEQTATGLKAWLQQNPITVQYELAEPITTKVSLTQSEPIVKIGTELPNGVCDTYNLLTGEHIQRVGKVVLDGSEAWTKVAFPSTNTTHCYSSLKIENLKMPNVNEKNIVSDRFQTVAQESYNYSNEEMYTWRAGELLYVNILRSRLSTSDVQGLKAWFKENPTTVWYELKNPIVTKRSGLPDTYGIVLPNGVRDAYDDASKTYTQNIGKVILNGTENWILGIAETTDNITFAHDILWGKAGHCVSSDRFETQYISSTNSNPIEDKESIICGNRFSTIVGRINITIAKSKLSSPTIEGFRQWLSQNPTTVYHELATPVETPICQINVGKVLPNGVCDTYNPVTKEYTQNIKKMVLNGDDSVTYLWETFSSPAEDTVIISITNLSDVVNGSGQITSDKIPFGTSSIDGVESILYNHNYRKITIEILKSRLTELNLAGFKKWLQKNPLTVWYQLATPVISKVNINMETLYVGHPIAYENGHVILESGHDGQSLLPTLEYSTVTNRVKQIESIGEQVLRQEKQLTMLEQMLIQNIIGMDYNNTLLTLNLEIDEVM